MAKKKATKDDELEIPKNLRRSETGLKGEVSHISIKVTNNKKVVIGSVIRTFPKVEDARDYLKGLSKEWDTDAFSCSNDGTVITCGPLDLITNYDVRLILKGKAPKGLLPHLIGERQRPGREGFKMPSSSAGKDVPASTRADKPKSAAAATGKVVVLKEICQKLKLDPRKARATLRSLTKANKVPRDAEGGRWQWTPEDAKKVEELLGG